jgi:HAD superfamily hydrolase (TIGR01509 family)
MGNRVTVPVENVRAVVFDMDGVLLDSEPLHHRAVNQLLAEEDKGQLSANEYVAYMGTTDDYTWRDLIRRFGLSGPIKNYVDRYDKAILELYRSCSRPAPGVPHVLTTVQSLGWGLAVASSSRREWVETCLAALDIRSAFNVVITGDLVRRSKPDPEIFNLAARCLGVRPEACIAIEDSPKGVSAAVGAGMFTIAVASNYAGPEQTREAHVQIDSLEDLDCLLAGTASIRGE